ncbi:MAG: 4Fe-4S dicluster domain-containing protein [Thermoprotei archaeon]
MSSSIVMYDRKLSNLIVAIGGSGIRECYQCGSCTAICPISENFSVSFRKTIKYAQLGLEKKMASDLTPWICYACGECSNSCPRDANPSALMMAFRRYLTIKYDWTGISRILYLSKKAELTAIFLLALIVGLGMYLFHGPIITDEVALETFAPFEFVLTAGLVILFILAVILIGNIYRMYKFTVGNLKIPLSVKLKELIKSLPIHFLTQKLFKYCTDKKYWRTHLLIFYGILLIIIGYTALFVLFVILLHYTPTDATYLLTKRIMGIALSITILYGTMTIIKDRIKKTKPLWKISHLTDWTFIILLVVVIASGFLTGIFRILDLPLATYITYTFHLMVAAPLLILEVGFLKGASHVYRLFALYFTRLNELKSKGVGNI